MPLSEEDIHQLEVLTQLFNAGKLSEDQFDRQTSNILRGVKRRKRRRTNSFIGRIFGGTSKPRKKRKRRGTSTPRKKVVVERRYLEDKLVEQVRASAVSQRPEPNVFPDNKYPYRKRAPSSSTLVSMRNSSRQQSSSIISTLFTIGGAVVLTLLISRSDPMERLIANLETSNATAIALPTYHGDTGQHFIEPLFGPLAVKQCRSLCSRRKGADQDICLRSCERFSISEYGRRITLSDLDARPDAKKIISRCTTKPIPPLEFESKDSWLTESRSALKLLHGASGSLGANDFGSTRLLYNNLIDANLNLRLPPNGRPDEKNLSRKLLRATCMRAHLTLTELAILMAKENADEFSRRFFRNLHYALRPQTEALEREVLSLAQRQKLHDA